MENLRGALLMMLSMAGFALEDALVKSVAGRIPMGEVLLFLGCGGALAFGLLANRQGHCLTSRLVFHRAVMLRNLFEMLGTASFVTALALIPLSLNSAIFQATPLFVTLGAIVFLGARVGWRRWAAIAVGLAGVLIILRPGFEGFEPAALVSVLAALALSGRDLAIRACPPEAHPLQLSAWGFMAIIPVGLAMLALSGGPVRPSGTEALMLGGAVGLAMLGYYALTLAMQLGEVAFVTPFRYIRLVYGIGLGWLVFSERPDAPMLIGSAIVVGAGLYALWRERRTAANRPFQSPAARARRQA
ncbi:MAG: DMT family transporter [Alphaproteobacteria bacterium]|nr:MAG: DMT family transporter [Alphaproteobacteria bacterium]